MSKYLRVCKGTKGVRVNITFRTLPTGYNILQIAIRDTLPSIPHSKISLFYVCVRDSNHWVCLQHFAICYSGIDIFTIRLCRFCLDLHEFLFALQQLHHGYTTFLYGSRH
jgi:hypothetical protein